MLRSSTATAVLYSLRAQDGVLGMPHVLEEEIKRQGKQAGHRARQSVQGGLEDLRRLLGSAPSPTLPSDEVLDQASAQRLGELERLLVRVPFDFEQAKEALRRVLDRVPPNGEKDQQYKDTLIWLATTVLARDFDVVVVTADKGFYADKDPNKGLAPELLADLAEDMHVIAVPKLAAAAEHLRSSQPPVDRQALVALIDNVAAEILAESSGRADFQFGPLTSADLHVFATEEPDRLAATFTLTHELADRRVPPRAKATAAIEGDCFIVDDQEVVDFRPARVSIDWYEPSGDPGHAGTVFVTAGDFIGERHERYRVRVDIEEVPPVEEA